MLLSILISMSLAKTIKVAVLDTGFKYEHISKVPTCQKYDSSIDDKNGHGTNVTGLIQKEAGHGDYCFYFYKVFLTNDNKATLKAIASAIVDKVDIINYSGGGKYSGLTETVLIKSFIVNGGVFVAASGNNSEKLTKGHCHFYPACSDPRIHVIGNGHKTSNYGPIVDYVIDGNKKTVYGITLTGSSQSAAIYSGKILKKMLKFQKTQPISIKRESI